MRCSLGSRRGEVRVRARLAVSGAVGSVRPARERKTFLAALVEPVRVELGGEDEACGKSKPPAVKEKLAGGGEGEVRDRGIGDVGAHFIEERWIEAVESRIVFRIFCRILCRIWGSWSRRDVKRSDKSG
jgi:hypothetical protein